MPSMWDESGQCALLPLHVSSVPISQVSPSSVKLAPGRKAGVFFYSEIGMADGR